MERGDDRVWLGRANLAMRTGDFDEAGQWLDACLKRRPEDRAVWRSRLRWAMATDRVDVVQDALARLPAAESSAAEPDRLAAWLATRRGDGEAERRARRGDRRRSGRYARARAAHSRG